MKSYTTIALLVLAAVCCTMPVLGAEKYLGGSPQITAYIAGTNQFSPGQDATIIVDIQNSGTSQVLYTNEGTLPQADLPTTAKLRHRWAFRGRNAHQHHDRCTEPW